MDMPMQWRIQNWSEEGFPKVANLSALVKVSASRGVTLLIFVIYLIFYVTIKQTHTTK